jgi:hypothetical protein
MHSDTISGHLKRMKKKYEKKIPNPTFLIFFFLFYHHSKKYRNFSFNKMSSKWHNNAFKLYQFIQGIIWRPILGHIGLFNKNFFHLFTQKFFLFAPKIFLSHFFFLQTECKEKFKIKVFCLHLTETFSGLFMRHSTLFPLNIAICLIFRVLIK